MMFVINLTLCTVWGNVFHELIIGENHSTREVTLTRHSNGCRGGKEQNWSQVQRATCVSFWSDHNI